MRRRRSRFSVAPTAGPTREELLTRLSARGVADRVRRLVEERLASCDASRVLDVEAEARRIYGKYYPADSPAPDPREAFTTVRERLKTGPSHSRFLNDVDAAMNEGNLLIDVLKEEVALARREFVESQLRDDSDIAIEQGTNMKMKREAVGNVTQPQLGNDSKHGQRSSHEALRMSDVKPNIPTDGRASTLKAMVKAKVGADAKITEFLNTLGMSKGPASQRRAGISSVGFKHTPVRPQTSSSPASLPTRPSGRSASPTDTQRTQTEKSSSVPSKAPGTPEASKHSSLVPPSPLCNAEGETNSNHLTGKVLPLSEPAATAPLLKASSRVDDTPSARSRAGSNLEKHPASVSCSQNAEDGSEWAIPSKRTTSAAVVSCRIVEIPGATPTSTSAMKEMCSDRRTVLSPVEDANTAQGAFEASNVPLPRKTVGQVPKQNTSLTFEVAGKKDGAQDESKEKIIAAVGQEICKGSSRLTGVSLNGDVLSDVYQPHEDHGIARETETKRLALNRVPHLKAVQTPPVFTKTLDSNVFGDDSRKVKPASTLKSVDDLKASNCNGSKDRSKSDSSVVRILSPKTKARSEKESEIDGSTDISRRHSVSEVHSAFRNSPNEANTVDGDDFAKVVVDPKYAAHTNASVEGTEGFEQKVAEIAVADAALASGVGATRIGANLGKASTSGNSMTVKSDTTQGEHELGKSGFNGFSNDEYQFRETKRPRKKPKLTRFNGETLTPESSSKIDLGCNTNVELLNSEKCAFLGSAECMDGVTELSRDSNLGKRKRRFGVNDGEEAEKLKSGLADNNEDIDVEGLDRVREVLAQIRQLPEACPFLEPVDSSAPGCETYYGEIKHPRNLGTICGHLGLIDGTGYYKSVEAVVRDVNLVWSNCFQFNPSRDRICDLARICKTRFEVLMERTGQVESSAGGARKSHRSTQGIHTRLLSDDRSVAALRRQKRMKGKSSTAASTIVKTPEPTRKTGGVRESTVQPPQKMTSPGAELVGHSLLVFCGLTLPGTDSEAVRWHHCTVLEYHEDDGTHDVLWVDFTEKSRHLSFAAGSDYCIFKDRGLAS
jgi:hypothetical protein